MYACLRVQYKNIRVQNLARISTISTRLIAYCLNSWTNENNGETSLIEREREREREREGERERESETDRELSRD